MQKLNNSLVYISTPLEDRIREMWGKMLEKQENMLRNGQKQAKKPQKMIKNVR